MAWNYDPNNPLNLNSSQIGQLKSWRPGTIAQTPYSAGATIAPTTAMPVTNQGGNNMSFTVPTGLADYGSDTYFKNLENTMLNSMQPQFDLGARRLKNLYGAQGALNSSMLGSSYNKQVEAPAMNQLQTMLGAARDEASKYYRDLPFKLAPIAGQGYFGENPFAGSNFGGGWGGFKTESQIDPMQEIAKRLGFGGTPEMSLYGGADYQGLTELIKKMLTPQNNTFTGMKAF